LEYEVIASENYDVDNFHENATRYEIFEDSLSTSGNLILYGFPEIFLPINVGDEWGEPPEDAVNPGIYIWFVEDQEDLATPAGLFSDCFRLEQRGRNSWHLVWICEGMGVVKAEYWQPNTIYMEIWELTEISWPS
jgi:hypothetical protein